MRQPTPAPQPVPATVEFRGATYEVSLTSFGAVLRSEEQASIDAHSTSVVAESTGVARSLIADWIIGGHLEGFTLLGAYFAVPDSHGQYPVRTFTD